MSNHRIFNAEKKGVKESLVELRSCGNKPSLPTEP